MNATHASASSTAFSTWKRAVATPPRRWQAPLEVTVVRPQPAAPRPRPRAVACGLDALISDGRRVTDPAAAIAALRAFCAGDRFMPGQMIDRVI